jgi:mono/diheme cytochrome c family protein
MRIGTRIVLGAAAPLLVAALVTPAALSQRSATTPKLIGNPKAGKALFLTTCSACHTLKAAGALGNIGPVLDKTHLTEATIIKAITKGGATVMPPAQVKKYSTLMQAYGGTLKPTQINDIAAFVFVSTNKT